MDIRILHQAQSRARRSRGGANLEYQGPSHKFNVNESWGSAGQPDPGAQCSPVILKLHGSLTSFKKSSVIRCEV